MASPSSILTNPFIVSPGLVSAGLNKFAMTIPGYDVRAELFRSDWQILYRACQHEKARRVLLKIPNGDPPRPAGAELLRREYELLRQLSGPGVPAALQFVHESGNCCLVLEDRGGTTLQELLTSGRPDLDGFFNLAVQICGALAELHRQDIVYKSLNPGSLLVAPDQEDVWLLDFSLAAKGPADAHVPLSTQPSLGALPYMSPEQTGRMNRTTDYRSDLYSLGVILYEVLTGACPFRSDDPLEVVHRHIAQNPPPPHVVNPAVPEPVSEIVMKLLSKTAEQRYQSALGLRKDLEACAREWSAHRQVPAFVLGQHDVSDRFLIPQKLYGRDAQVKKLVSAFERACEGPSALMLVAGYSGIGKTSLIQELYKPIVRQRGYFIAGKFDLVVPNIPFGAPVQAFRELVQQLLTESDDSLAAWRVRLSKALGPNTGVLAQVIPEIELILGPQPPPVPLGPTEAQNRFRLVFQNFVGALSSRDHPLVVSLDDLQRADPATLDLLQALLTSPAVQCLFLIGAYRDNEVDAAHPLVRALDTLEAEGARVQRLSVGPLALHDLALFIRDTLHGDPSQVEPLANLVLQKTGGNPFFVIQFLKTLKQEGLIKFDYAQGRWTFQLDAIAGAGITDNVIDLMIRKIQRLSPKTQAALTLASCIGNQFDLRTLATVTQRAVDGAAEDLAEAVDEGLAVPLGGSYEASTESLARPEAGSTTYAFRHDRVQQAAYRLIPDERKHQVHLNVGRLMRDRWDAATAEERLFDLVNHLNLGSPLIVDEAERLGVAELDLKAGRKAKASAAYQGALGFFKVGLGLLREQQWDSRYELTFALHLEVADCEYLCGNFDRSQGYCEVLLGRARSPLDRARVHALRTVQYENMSRFADAVRSGREGLAVFRVSLPDTEEGQRAALDAEMSEIEGRLGGRSITSLVDLPLMADIEIRTIMRILMTMWAPSYLGGDQALTRLISAIMVRLSLAHGNSEESAYGYVTHAITVGPERGDYKTAHEFGTLALALNERLGDAKLRAKIHQQFHAHVNLWRRPLKTCLPHAREAYRTGLETGDFTYAAYGACTESWHALWTCPDLGRFVREYSGNVALLEKLKMAGFADAQRVMLGWALALQGRTRGPTSLSGDDLDEESYASTHAANPFMTTFFQIAKLQLYFTFEEYEKALEAARRAEAVVRALGGTIWPVLLDFWTGLTLTALYEGAGEQERRRYWNQLMKQRESLNMLAENCPENFRCFSLLLTAETERVSGHFTEAHRLYEEAILYADETGNLLHEALADELFARFRLRRGQPKFSGQFLTEARNCYERWGAHAKVQDLERKYPEIAKRVPALASQLGLAAGDARDPQELVSLDLSTVLKAARALAVEIDLDSLLRKLMQIALENAGAQRGVFLQEKDGQLFVEAEGSVDDAQVRRSIPLDHTRDFSQSVVRYVRKTRESVVITDATTEERFAGDAYILSARPRSILCVPCVYEGKLAGILYLENNLTADAFTSARVEMMRVLSTTAAISLEKARLYDEMKQEVSRRRQAEGALRESEARFRTMANAAPVMIWIAGPDAGLSFFNEQCLHFTGRSMEQMTGEGWIEDVHAEDRVVCTEAYLKAFQARETFQMEYRVRRADGVYRWIEDRGVPLNGPDGSFRGYVGSCVDITERRRGEQMLRTVTEGTASVTGSDFFSLLVRHLALALSVSHAFVAECRDGRRARSLAYWNGDRFGENFEFDIAGTPCQNVLQGETCLYSENLQRLFPDDKGLVDLGVESYLGVPLFDSSRRVIGHLAVLDTKSMPEDSQAITVLKIFAARAGAELERQYTAEALQGSHEEIAALKARLEAENVYLQEEIRTEHNFVEIVGNSPALLAVLRKVEQIAPTDATVLILGETGTGKELIARAIHDRSPRKERPLVKVNCSAISAGLVESELFGHVKGAFTGAIDRRVGRFELADGGTIFLDEIGELPLETQVKLLRVLQEQEFEPVGSSRTVRVNVRIIAATNRDLEQAVQAGRFRSDLFYRLNVFPLLMPPLRERRSDIPSLAAFFLERFSRKFGKTVEGVSHATMRRLSEYAWPGNIRELQNIVERGVVLSQGSLLTLDPNLLPTETSDSQVTRSGPQETTAGAASRSHPGAGTSPSNGASLEEVEREHILSVLKQTAGIVEGPRGAARILNLHPNTLRSRMKKLGIPTKRHEIS
ncbi:MAG: hypothetical protein DMG27_01925 [Acidobacteria bacterium]|nr:MAG: hypothetical protein DMG27_01925 [Acidobacteriota bacterium]